MRSVAIDTRRRDPYARAFVAALRRLAIEVRERQSPWRLWRDRPDVVHGLDGVLPPWRRSPGVVTVWRERWEPTRADLVVCPSAWLAAELSARPGVDAERLRVVPFAPALSLGDDPPPRRGPYVLALADVPVGGRELVVDRAPSEALLRGAAVLVHPGRRDAAGLVAMEAMTRGVPVVAARAGALPEVVADAGILVDTAEEIPAAVQRALEERDRLAEAGRERAALYSWEATAQAMVLVYRELWGGPLA
jgi:hypothetical protein